MVLPLGRFVPKDYELISGISEMPQSKDLVESWISWKFGCCYNKILEKQAIYIYIFVCTLYLFVFLKHCPGTQDNWPQLARIDGVST